MLYNINKVKFSFADKIDCAFLWRSKQNVIAKLGMNTLNRIKNPIEKIGK